jgi:hypothetical protein
MVPELQNKQGNGPNIWHMAQRHTSLQNLSHLIIKTKSNMKHLLVAMVVCLLATTTAAQSEKYVKAMEEKVAVLDTTRSIANLQSLANAFERIATAEKSQWLPYYYAALANVNVGYAFMQSGNLSGIDAVTDKAEALLAQAEALSSNNPEIFIVKKMAHSIRFMVDPQSRYMQYAPLAQAALDKAKSLDPENPRVYLLEGQDKLFTPQQYGGSKTEAKKLFELAAQKYNNFKPASSIAPRWGQGMNQYFLSQVSK